MAPRNEVHWLAGLALAAAALAAGLTVPFRQAFATGLLWGLALVLAAAWAVVRQVRAGAAADPRRLMARYAAGATVRAAACTAAFLALLFAVRVDAFGLLAGLTAGLALATAAVLAGAVAASRARGGVR